MQDRILTILVTGAHSQLGSELQVIAPQFPWCQFLFATKEQLDITDYNSIIKYFSGHSIDYCINCAAYTAVDKSELEKEEAFLINADAVAILAKICCKNKTQLIHISTDYVFNGTATKPYKETDQTSPVGTYGISKLQGEELAIKHCPSTIIIRTSWLYSSFKNNFVKTMLKLMKEKSSINVVNDQLGCPTYAADLAAAIMHIINSGKSLENPGIYNYANAGTATWYGFADAIKDMTGSDCTVNAIPTAQYRTPAKRPAYSVLDTTKIKKTFGVKIPKWEDSLKACLKLIN